MVTTESLRAYLGPANATSDNEGRLRWLTREEAKALVRAAGVEPKAPYLAPLVILALHMDAPGELLGLEWDRVDLKAR